MNFFDSIAAIIVIIGCADALKATSLIFGKSSNKNLTTTTTSTSTTASPAAETDGDGESDVRTLFKFYLRRISIVGCVIVMPVIIAHSHSEVNWRFWTLCMTFSRHDWMPLIDLQFAICRFALVRSTAREKLSCKRSNVKHWINLHFFLRGANPTLGDDDDVGVHVNQLTIPLNFMAPMIDDLQIGRLHMESRMSPAMASFSRYTHEITIIILWCKCTSTHNKI